MNTETSTISKEGDENNDTFNTVSKSNSQDTLAHSVGEYMLFRYYAFEFILYFSVIQIAIKLRRVAYMLHVPMFTYIEKATNVSISESYISNNPDDYRLHDIFFEILPDLSKDPIYPAIGDILSATCFLLSTYPLAIGVFCRRNETKVFMVSIIVRMMRCLALLELMRPLFYIWTSFPAPDINCISHSETKLKPKSINDLFNGGIMDQGCGDLIFSGHMTSNVVGLLVNFYYMGQVYGSRFNICIGIHFAIITMIAIADALVILLVRHHYTIDIVSSIIICTLVWLIMVRYTKDINPSEINAKCFCVKKKYNVLDVIESDTNYQKARFGILIMFGICVTSVCLYIIVIVRIFQNNFIQ